jgi:hypothetical protein
MTCKELQNLLYSARIDEFNPTDLEFLKHHLAECESCAAVFYKVSNADRILTRIKETVPRIPDEEALTESIIAAIAGFKRHSADVPFFDRLYDVFSMKVVRTACTLVFLFCIISYMSMEYNDAKAIVGLEQRMGNQSISSRAGVFYQDMNIPDFLHGLYMLSNGTISSIELTKTLVLIKKADLQNLLKDYKALDEASKVRLNAMYDEYIKEEPSLPYGSKINSVEAAALQNEIKRLKMELERRNNTKERP